MADKQLTGVSLEDFIDRRTRLMAYPHDSGLYMVVQVGGESIRITIEQLEELADLYATFGGSYTYNKPAWWRERSDKRDELRTRLEARAASEAAGVLDLIAPMPAPPEPPPAPPLRERDATLSVGARRAFEEAEKVGTMIDTTDQPATVGATADEINGETEIPF